MVETIISSLSGIPAGWRVFFLSMLPITELRAAIPLGAMWGMTPFEAFLWAIIGNFVPVIPLLLVMRWLYRVLYRYQFWRRPLDKLALHGKKNEEKVRRGGWISLAVLVAVPLPGTGVWTGCLIATLLGLSFWPSVAAITIGEIMAGLSVSLITGGVVAMSDVIAIEYIVAILLVVILIIYLCKLRKHRS